MTLHIPNSNNYLMHGVYESPLSYKKNEKDPRVIWDDDTYDDFLYVEWKAGSYPKFWTLNSIFLHRRNQCQFIMQCAIYIVLLTFSSYKRPTS